MNGDLRQALEELLQFDVGEQENRLLELQTEYNHSIVVIDCPALFPPGRGTYNCYAYALNLVGLEGYFQIASAPLNRRLIADSEFIQFLLDRNELVELENDINIEDGMIVYFMEDNPSHAGKIQHGRVTSKWGDGLLFEHDLFDVPLVYGGIYRIYRGISADDALELFYDFSETKGWEFESD